MGLARFGRGLDAIAERLGGLMDVRQRLRGDFSLIPDSRPRHCSAGSWPLRVVLPCFTFGVLAGGVSRGRGGRCARGGSVVRFLQRAVLCEVGEDGADRGGLFNAAHDP